MQNKTTTNTTKDFTNGNEILERVCPWETGDIFSANLMFPTKHFKDLKQLENMEESEFCLLIQEMLEVCQPLHLNVAKALAKSVLSGNRLRVYYQAYNYVSRHLEVIGDLTTNDENIGSLDEKDLLEACEFRGHSITNDPDQYAYETI